MKISLKIALIVVLAVVLSILLSQLLIIPKTQHLSKIVQLYAIFILAIAPISLLSWFLIYKLIINPVLYLKSISKVIASGNLGKIVEIKGSDEMAELSKNFSTILKNLASGMQDLANSLRAEKLKKEQLAENFVELDKEKAKADALLASIGEGVIAIDTSQRVILFNQAARTLTGLPSQDVVGKPYFETLHFLNEKDESTQVDFISKALKGEKIDEKMRVILVRKDGSKLPISHSTSYILDASNNIIGVVAAIKDMTYERQLEKLKDEFVSIASHELRTPMTAIKGLVSMIQEGDYGEINQPLKEPLADIGSSTERLIQLVNDILDVSRIEAGRTKYKVSDFPLRELVDGVASSLEVLVNQKGLALELAHTFYGHVTSDPNKIKQVLFNLLSNAIKFTDQGSIKILTRSSDAYAFVSVSDNGIGIPLQEQHKLFTKFSQLDTQSMGRPPGTGLGLYISKQFLQALGGDIWIEHSEAGKGSTFTFSIPLTNTPLSKTISEKLSSEQVN